MKLLTEKEAALFLGCSIYKLQRDRRKGSPIPFIKIGSSVKYKFEDLVNYVDANTYSATSEYGGAASFILSMKIFK